MANHQAIYQAGEKAVYVILPLRYFKNEPVQIALWVYIFKPLYFKKG